MKSFESCSFSLTGAVAELASFKSLLDSKGELSERHDIMPFFRQHRHLSLALGLLSSNLSLLDRLAYEYDLFGDFACDLMIGDSQGPAYALIELRDRQLEQGVLPYLR